MANPGYPMQHMPPMGHPPGPPMGPGGPGGPMPPRAQVVRRGTSKVVPVVVSAGLAIGVFCGLLFGLGTGDDAEAEATSAPVATTKKQTDSDVPEPFQPTTNNPKPAAGSGQAVAAGSGSGSATGTIANATAGSGAGSGSAATVVPIKPIGKLKVEVTPEAAAKNAKILVDGTQIEGNELEIDLSDVKGDPSDLKKTVKVVVKSSGYRDVEQMIAVLADKENTLQVELVKRARGGSGLPRPPPPGGSGKKGDKKKPPGGGGLIDI